MAAKSKTGQKRTKRKRGSYLPDVERMKIVTLHLAGKSYREIARAMRRDKSTIQRIVQESPELRVMNEAVIEGYRIEMLGVLRDAMDSLRRLVRDDNPKAVLACLQGAHVLVPRTEQFVTKKSDQFANKTDEELEHYAKTGKWPEGN